MASEPQACLSDSTSQLCTATPSLRSAVEPKWSGSSPTPGSATLAVAHVPFATRPATLAPAFNADITLRCIVPCDHSHCQCYSSSAHQTGPWSAIPHNIFWLYEVKVPPVRPLHWRASPCPPLAIELAPQGLTTTTLSERVSKLFTPGRLLLRFVNADSSFAGAT